MKQTESTGIHKAFRIPEQDLERAQRVADVFYEGNLSMALRQALREWVERNSAELEVVESEEVAA